MYHKLQPPEPQSPLSLDLEDKMGKGADRWAEAGSPTEAAPHQLGFVPMSGRLLKSESEDSGVEMASNDHSPSTPIGSEKSFSLDCLDGFPLSGEDDSCPAPQEGGPKEDRPEEPVPAQDRAYRRNLSVSKKLAQVVQRSQKHRLPVRSPRLLTQRPRSLVDLEGLKSCYPHRPVSVDGSLDAASGGRRQAVLGCSTPKEQPIEEEAQQPSSLPMPGQGLRYLEHICQMLEKIAQLQRANMQLHHQRQVLECRIRGQELENEGFSEDIPEDSKLPHRDPQPGDPAAMEIEKEEVNPSFLDSWHPHLFRTNSASDTRILRRQTPNLGNKIDCSRKTTAHSASSPSLLDQLDGNSHTLPPGMKLKNDHSHWGKVKVLINRITRKSAQTNELTPSSDTTSNSRHCRADIVLDKEGSYPRRHFLPTLVAKKQRSKHLSMG
ncbi:uncharacterized protein C8orf58 homolog isoform X2 [Candoia aspera]